MVQENTAKSFLDPKLISLMKNEVSRIKKEEQPVNRAFEAIAKKSGLKFNTVKNYYYRYIHEKDNEKRLSNTNNAQQRYIRDVAGSTFTDQEVRELMIAMLEGQAKGKSVRACANELANRDNRLMLRYQNKYRNVLLGNPEYVEKLMGDMSELGMIYYNPLRKQVVKDKEIVSEGELFDIIGSLVSNINEINSPVLDGFLKGLQDLSRMAAQYRRQREEDGGGLQGRLEQSERILKKYRSDTLSIINRLMAINRDFISLSPAGKLTGLSEYIRQVENCIRDCQRKMVD
ncbi:MAG TPA: hypothetical protein VFD57_08185 [Clostridia bacterium]|nr:hypothetical protein [Clostridia bacterium]